MNSEYQNTHLDPHGNYIVDHGKSWKNQEIVFFEFLWEPCVILPGPVIKVWP